MKEEHEWANLLAGVFGNLTQKHTPITYDFENIQMKDAVEKEGKAVPTGTVSPTRKLTDTTR